MKEHQCNVKVSLDLNEEVRFFIRNRLKEFALEHPDFKFEINCWVDDLVTDSVHEIYNYLAKNGCPSILKKGGDIIGKCRAQFHNIAKR